MIQFTLRTMRESSGLTVEEVAKHLELNTEDYLRLSTNPELVTLDTVRKIKELYGIPLELIYIGSEKNCIENNRKNIFLKYRKIKTG